MSSATRVTVALLVGCALIATGCASATNRSTTDSGQVKVVAAFYPVAAAAQRVGGNCVEVTNLTPAGAEPHDLELIPDQVDAIQDAAVVFVMGHGFQPAVERAAADRDGPTVEVLDGLRSKHSTDPHVWLDPVRYSKLVETVTAALVKVAPKCRAKMEANAASYTQEIEQVNQQYAAGLAHCKRHTIVTAHEAFGHLAKRYGLRQEGVAGLSPDAEPDAQRLGQLAGLVKRDGVTVIFTEALLSPRIAQTLARETGARTETLDPLEGLTDSERARGDDYVSIMDGNLTKLRDALGCS